MIELIAELGLDIGCKTSFTTQIGKSSNNLNVKYDSLRY